MVSYPTVGDCGDLLLRLVVIDHLRLIIQARHDRRRLDRVPTQALCMGYAEDT